MAVNRITIRDKHGNVLFRNTFAGVDKVNVSVAPGTGVPEAESSYSNGELSIILKNIKGNGISGFQTIQESQLDGGTSIYRITDDLGNNIDIAVRNGLRGNGITDILTEQHDGDGEENILTIKTTDNPQGITIRIKNGSRGNGIESVNEQMSGQDGGINTHTITDTDGNTHVIHTRNGRTGPQGPQGDSVIVGEGELPLAHVLGQDNTKAMSQKGVTDEINLVKTDAETEEHIMYSREYTNILDNSAITEDGYINPWAGTITSVNNVKTTPFVPVTPGKKYTLVKTGSSTNSPQNLYIAGFDSSKQFVGTRYTTLTLVGTFKSYEQSNMAIFTTETIPNNVHYLRWSIKNTEKSNIMCVEGEIYPSQFIAYNTPTRLVTQFFNDKVRALIPDVPTSEDVNPLYGKSISLTGDSVCYGAGYQGGFAKIIGDRNNMSVSNIAVSGGTIVEVSGHFDIGHSIQNMTIGDYNILTGGVNDASLSVPLGSRSSSYDDTFDESTFYGALENMLKNAVIRFSGKKLGFIIFHAMVLKNSSWWTADNGYYNAIVKCLTKWGVPLLDLSKEIPPFAFFDSGDLATLKTSYTLNGDGWHPNEAGYKKYYCDKIEAWLKTL